MGEKEKNLKGLETYGKLFLLGISIIKFKDFSFWTKNVKNLVIWVLPVVDCLVLFFANIVPTTAIGRWQLLLFKAATTARRPSLPI